MLNAVELNTVTFVVGITGSVVTLIVGTFAYFKDRRDARTQLLRDVEMVERMAASATWGDEPGKQAQALLKSYVYERISALSIREKYGRRFVVAMFVLPISLLGFFIFWNIGGTDDPGTKNELLGNLGWICVVVFVSAALQVVWSYVLLKRRTAAMRPPPRSGTP